MPLFRFPDVARTGTCPPPPSAGGRVTGTARVQTEPVHRPAGVTGSGLSPALAPAIAEALACAGEGLDALLVSGSHATGEAVWTAVEGRDVSLSDLDLYAVLHDDALCNRARARARARRAQGLLQVGDALAGPLEIAFVTQVGLAGMPARPGTVELSRSGRVVHGDANMIASLPRWQPAAVSAEERLLLLENRAFELLWAFAQPHTGLAALRARHAVLKTALDLARVRLFARGECPVHAAGIVAAASSLGEPAGCPSWLVGAWDALAPILDEAVAWRREGARASLPDTIAPAWRAVVRGWCAVWWGEAVHGLHPTEPFARASRVARRGSLARRVRRSLAFRAADGSGPSWPERLVRAAQGTPALRIHGSAAMLLLAAAPATGAPSLSGEALRALRSLGVTRAERFEDAAAEVVAAWDRRLHEGLRTGGAA